MAQWHSKHDTVYGPAAAPLAWTDLDISEYTGTQRVLVALKVSVPTLNQYVSFRTNGDTGDFRSFAVGARGVHTVHEQMIDGSLRAALIIVETDENGIVEWISDGVNNVTIELQGWASTQHLGSTVFGGLPPAAWTDLDVSSFVGANRALLLLRIEETAGIAQGLGVRRNGTTYEMVPAASETAACTFCEIAANDAAYLLVETDANGVIEIKRFNAGAGVLVISIEAYDVTGWNNPNAGEEEVYNAALPIVSTNLDLSQSTTPAPTGLPAVNEVLALCVVHDVLVGAVHWNVRPDLDASSWEQIASDSSGTSALWLQAGANLAVTVAQETNAGIVEQDASAARVAEITLAGWIDPFDGHVPTISRQYPAAEQIVTQDTEIRFRLADIDGINLSTLNVTLTTVDDTRALITSGSFVDASGTILANEVWGYDVVIHPTETLGDRRWLVTVDVENSDRAALP